MKINKFIIISIFLIKNYTYCSVTVKHRALTQKEINESLCKEAIKDCSQILNSAIEKKTNTEHELLQTQKQLDKANQELQRLKDKAKEQDFDEILKRNAQGIEKNNLDINKQRKNSNAEYLQRVLSAIIISDKTLKKDKTKYKSKDKFTEARETKIIENFLKTLESDLAEDLKSFFAVLNVIDKDLEAGQKEEDKKDFQSNYQWYLERDNFEIEEAKANLIVKQLQLKKDILKRFNEEDKSKANNNYSLIFALKFLEENKENLNLISYKDFIKKNNLLKNYAKNTDYFIALFILYKLNFKFDILEANNIRKSAII